MTCSICLNEVKPTRNNAIRCGHIFHKSCIERWKSQEPEFLIADEPTTALDVTIQGQILELIQQLQERLQMSVQFITHDLGVISEVSDEVLVMYAGTACEKAPTDLLMDAPRHPYTVALMQSIPRIGRRVPRLPAIAGTVPTPHELPAGCPFQNRCPRVVERCRVERPGLGDNRGKIYTDYSTLDVWRGRK